jgi:tRNA pseudouridine55 synthase
MNGIINVYKEEGFTSHDVVARLRGMLHEKHVGHTGTLDPMATGVLPVCFGNATRVCDLIQEKEKEYIFTMKLGVLTDTLDRTGTIISEDKNIDLTDEEIAKAVSSFVGNIEQVPPMYSALKVHGRRLYELAREGKTVERKKRQVTIREIEILPFDAFDPDHYKTTAADGQCDTDNAGAPQSLSFSNDSTDSYKYWFSGRVLRARAVVSRGTYIRTLADDIGQKLGTHGTMTSLIRTASGIFRIGEAHKLSDIGDIFRKGDIGDILLPVDSLFMNYPALKVPEESMKYLLNGNKLPADIVDRSAGNAEAEHKSAGKYADDHEVLKDPEKIKKALNNTRFRIYGSDGTFKAVYELYGDELKPVKMFL